MAELLLPNFMAAAREGQARGQQRGLASLMGQALTQPDQRQALIGKMAGTDPGAAMEAQQHFDTQAATQKKANRDRLVQLSEVMLKAPQMAAQVYPEFRASLSAELGPNVNLPEQFEPGALDAAKAFVDKAGQSAAVQEFQFLTQGMAPDDVMKARRVAAGLDPRPSSAAYGYQKLTGPDGREYLVATDPRGVGATTIGGGPSFGSLGQQAPGQSDPAQDFASLSQKYGIRPSSTLRSPEHNRQVGGVPNSYHLSGEAADYPVPQAMKANFMADARAMGYEAIDEGDHVHIEPPRRGQSGGPNPFASRSAEETEYAKQNAKNQADIDTYRVKAGLEAEAAADKKRAEAGAERDAIAATKVVDARKTLALLDEAEKLIPQSTGSNAGNAYDSVNAMFGKSTEGAQAIASLRTIAGQLTSSMPRMQGPQSDKDVLLYQQMAGDLANPNLPRETRLAALGTIRRLNQKYAGGSDVAPSNAVPQQGAGKYQVGQVIEMGGKRYRVTDASDPNDPDVEEI